MMKKSGQAGIEYVVLTGLLMFFFIPIMHYSFQESTDAIKTSQLSSYISRLSKSIEAVHSIGPGAMEVVVVNAPKGIQDATLHNIYYLKGSNEIVLRVNIDGAISDIHSTVKPYIFGEIPKTQGTYHLKVRCINETSVNITIT
jgi:hypothetical protein